MRDYVTAQSVGRLVAVVVTYQRLEKLQATLARLLISSEYHLSHVVVVDNASHDGTAEWLESVSDPRVVVLRQSSNIGGAGGFSVGVRYAHTELDADWVLVMDDDARPNVGTIEKFHSRPRDTRQAWASAVYYPSGELCEMNRPTRNPAWHLRALMGFIVHGRKGFHLTDDDFAGTEPVAIDASSFVGLFISRESIEMIGYPDASVFIYGDDVLYTLGIRKAGGKIDFDPTLRFEHDCESTLPQSKIYTPIWRAYYHHRNLIFVYREAAGVLFWPVFLVFFLQWIIHARAYGKDAPVFRTLLRSAVLDGLRNDRSRSLAEVQRIGGPRSLSGPSAAAA